jgi:hypothetical protein
MAQARREQGIALVIALVFLLMLTILGVAVMNTASLEGRMSGNTQEMNRAFLAAESAFDYVFKDASVYSSLVYPGNETSTNVYYPNATNWHSKVDMTITRGPDTKILPRPKDRLKSFGLGHGGANFEMKSNATTVSNANSRLTQGVAQVKPQNNY